MREHAGRIGLGRVLIWATTALLAILVAVQLAHTFDWIDRGFSDWRPVGLAFVFWAFALCVGLVLARGVRGERAVFLLPAVLLTLAFVVFPTIFAIYVAFTDWNLSAVTGRRFNGLDNFRLLIHDGDYRQALINMVIFSIGVLVQYAIGFGLALLLNQNVRGQKFFRVAFLLPFMLSPVAVSWMIGKSILNNQYGPLAKLLEKIGFENVAFYGGPWIARASIMSMDAWYSIPFIMVLLLAGLQALPHEVMESARVDGATAWQSFRDITYPLMLPVSVTAVVLRIIFELKIFDIIRTVTNGSPGGKTDSATNLIYRVGIERTNVGYGTAMAQVYLIFVIIFVSLILATAGRWARKFAA
jgi:multiple sugar transport system permease protein